MKKISLLLMSVLTIFTLSSCSEDAVTEIKSISEAKEYYQDVELDVNEFVPDSIEGAEFEDTTTQNMSMGIMNTYNYTITPETATSTMDETLSNFISNVFVLESMYEVVDSFYDDAMLNVSDFDTEYTATDVKYNITNEDNVITITSFKTFESGVYQDIIIKLYVEDGLKTVEFYYISNDINDPSLPDYGETVSENPIDVYLKYNDKKVSFAMSQLLDGVDMQILFDFIINTDSDGEYVSNRNSMNILMNAGGVSSNVLMTLEGDATSTSMTTNMVADGISFDSVSIFQNDNNNIELIFNYYNMDMDFEGTTMNIENSSFNLLALNGWDNLSYNNNNDFSLVVGSNTYTQADVDPSGMGNVIVEFNEMGYLIMLTNTTMPGMEMPSTDVYDITNAFAGLSTVFTKDELKSKVLDASDYLDENSNFINKSIRSITKSDIIGLFSDIKTELTSIEK